MTEARTKRLEEEGAFFSIDRISFRNTSGLTNVPINSADLMHCVGTWKTVRGFGIPGHTGVWNIGLHLGFAIPGHIWGLEHLAT